MINNKLILDSLYNDSFNYNISYISEKADEDVVFLCEGYILFNPYKISIDKRFNSVYENIINLFYNKTLNFIKSLDSKNGFFIEIYNKCLNYKNFLVLKEKYLDVVKILLYICDYNQDEIINIYIDGPCSAGKTTLSIALSEVLMCDVIHMDDFFLPINLRTSDRLNELGGNIHYERFIEEVVPNLYHNNSFSYNAFDCSIMDIKDKITIRESNFHIIEGVYSHHFLFKNGNGIYIFKDISEEVKLDRIKKRNGSILLQRFINEWIPLENLYFEKFNIRKLSNMIL